MSDPWSLCKILYEENGGHFIERMKDRSYSGPDFREFLVKGVKEPASKKDTCSQDFKITYQGWIICCKLRSCNIVMGTLYHE
ncbi:MAG: hypothetical protein B2I18_03845 [Cuniculiplasma sp. C_DKE]|nr:MAG: hypothetical protein B2I18_03845 [Cuniculiplasma sp. C_DKE]